MALTPDIQRAHALVEVECLVKKIDAIMTRTLGDMEIHVHGWDNQSPGSFAAVRPRTLEEGLRLEPRPE